MDSGEESQHSQVGVSWNEDLPDDYGKYANKSEQDSKPQKVPK
jgi:hypothetical protein